MLWFITLRIARWDFVLIAVSSACVLLLLDNSGIHDIDH